MILDLIDSSLIDIGLFQINRGSVDRNALYIKKVAVDILV